MFLIPYTASLYNGLSRLFGMAFSIDYAWCIVLMSVLTAIYVIAGGYMATAINDFIQGLVMLVGISAIVWATLASKGGLIAALDGLSRMTGPAMLPGGEPTPGIFTSFFGPDPLNLLFVVILTSLGTWGLPQMVQKFYAIKDEGSIKKQSRAIATLDSNSALTTRNGGPGHRADLSAFYPVVLTNGSAVAVLNPATCSDIYRLLGQSYGNTNGVSGVSASTPETYFSKGVCKRLLVFGMGRSSDITTALFETPPRCEVLDKTYYRNYLLVFSMNNGSGNSGTTVEFVGVIDPQGNTAAAAQYNID